MTAIVIGVAELVAELMRKRCPSAETAYWQQPALTRSQPVTRVSIKACGVDHANEEPAGLMVAAINFLSIDT